VTSVIGAVPVATTTSRVSVSNSTTPLDLPTAGLTLPSISGTVSYTPANLSGIPTMVTASQGIVAVPSFTVKYQAADQASGSYILTQLPTLAPVYAAYSTTLPLVFVPATAVLPGAGSYIVTSSTTGYASKVNNAVNVSTGDKTGINFAMTQ
jgi:hypothetical protein